MQREHRRYYNGIQALLNIGVVIVSYMLAWYLRFESGFFRVAHWTLPIKAYLQFLPLIILVYVIFYYVFQLYTSKRIREGRLEIWHIFQANILGVLLLTLILYLTKETNFSRTMLFLFGVVNTCLQILLRCGVWLILRKIRQGGYNQKQIILVGYGRVAEQFIDRVVANPNWGYVIRGVLSDHQPRGKEYRGIKVIGTIEDLTLILSQNHLDEVVITLGIQEYANLERVVALCEKTGVHTKFIPDYNNIIPTRPHTEEMMGLPVINIRHVPLSEIQNKSIKRAVDLLGATIGLILASPIMLLVAIAIKISSPGPLIFKQERIGLGNKSFLMYKFRSMVVQEKKKEEGKWTTQNDPRVTGIGRLIRRTSMDELPQLWNVLKGDMSLVGPRPERPFFVEKFKEEIPRYMIKHQVRPGLTGWAQVNGFRGDTSIRGRIDCDLYYIENWTLGLDIKIMFLTILRGFINKNAY